MLYKPFSKVFTASFGGCFPSNPNGLLGKQEFFGLVPRKKVASLQK